jgi:F-type H+-transporting ATPase subunit b
VLTAVVTRGPQIQITFVAAEEGERQITFEESQDFCEFPFETEAEFTAAAYPCDDPTSPLDIELKELAWGGGAFIVLLLLMRLWLYPVMKKGLDAREAHIRAGHEQAEQARSAARAEVEAYESALVEIKAEAAQRIDAARQTLEAERTARLAEVNAAVAARQAEAAAAAAEARAAVRGEIAAAVVDVTGRTVELAVGRVPDDSTIRRAVDSVMGAEVGS